MAAFAVRFETLCQDAHSSRIHDSVILRNIVCVQGEIYFFWTENGWSDGGRVLADVPIYNAFAGVWRLLRMPLSIHHRMHRTSITAAGANIIIHCSETYYNNTVIIDTQEETFVVIPYNRVQRLPPPSIHCTLTLVSLPEDPHPTALRGDCLIRVGGEDENGYLNQIYGLCLQSKSWRRLFDPEAGDVAHGDVFLLNREVAKLITQSVSLVRLV